MRMSLYSRSLNKAEGYRERDERELERKLFFIILKWLSLVIVTYYLLPGLPRISS
jgi:hypothetical protein